MNLHGIRKSLSEVATRLLVLSVCVTMGRPAPVFAADPAMLNIRVVEGDGATYVTGSRATRGVTVLIADETGAPVDGAIVSFSLPPDGPSGAFANGTRTEIATTRPDGRASAWGMQWNRTPGPLEIRVTALKGQARAGITATEYLVTSAQNAAAAPAASRDSSVSESRDPGPRRVLGVGSKQTGGHRWLWTALAVAGAAVAGAAVAGRSGSSTAAASAPTPTVQIGSPSITLGRP